LEHLNLNIYRFLAAIKSVQTIEKFTIMMFVSKNKVS